MRGRKTILTEKQHHDILELVQEQPDITMKEIVETLHLSVGDEAVRRFLIKQGYTYKKKSLHAKNRSVPDVQRKRSQWIETISGAHAVHGKRAMDATPINTPAGATVLSSIRLNGSLVYTTY